MRPITIVGGGLAGLSLGCGLLRRGVPVTVCEAGSYPRHRVCGEFISGVRAGTMETLGIEEVLADARPLHTTAWSVGEEVVLQTALPEPGRGISRYRLDRMLAERFLAAGGELRERNRKSRVPGEGLVWATGRPAVRGSGWLGLKVHVRNMESIADLEMHLGRRGYVGLARVEEDRVNVCGLFQREAEVGGRSVELLGGYLKSNGLDTLWERIVHGRPDSSSLVGVNAFNLGRQEGNAGLCAVGDAESMIPPFTGNGMSMAFEAAECAVEPLSEYAAGVSTWTDCSMNVAGRLHERFAKRLFTARLLHPLLFKPAGRELLAAGARAGVLPFAYIFRSLR